MQIREMTVNMVAWAKAAAVMAHESVGQCRKYGNAHYGRERYYFHPCRVAELVATVTDSPRVISAAALHDVLEDVSPKSPVFTPRWILASFGPEVLLLIIECSNFYTVNEKQREILFDALELILPEFPGKVSGLLLEADAAFKVADGAEKQFRKLAEIERYGAISDDAKIIKRADIFDNRLALDGAESEWAANWRAAADYADGIIGSWLDYETEVRAEMPELART